MLAMLPRELYSKPITPSPYYTRLDSSESLPYETMMAALSHPYRLVLDHDRPYEKIGDCDQSKSDAP